MKEIPCLFKNMWSNKVSVVCEQLENILQFLNTHLAFANCHMVDYFTKNLYKTHIPIEIQEEISVLGLKKAINIVTERNEGSYALNLKSFTHAANSCALHSLKDICLKRDDLYKLLFEMGGRFVPGVNLKVFASPKKSHEVETLSSIIYMLKHICNSTHAIDIGDGKGYLSSMLALQYSIPVLGIDSSSINTKSASKRADKLQKAWINLIKCPTKSVPLKDEACTTQNHLYKQTTKYCDESTDLKELVSNAFINNCDKCSLTGLHTCGNLSSTSLKMYCKHSYIKSVCNVGCCYHLVTEKYEDSHQKEESYGFPLSHYMQTKRFVLGRQARMLASQSIDRILANKVIDNKTIFFRAVFQVILERYYPHLRNKHIGRLKKECNSFLEYVRFAAKRINVEFDLTEQEINKVYTEYENRETEINGFYLLRSFLAQVVECVILLDRLLFLLEQGYNCTYLVQVFDRVLSPRCYSIISIKDD